jgi:hypothetical protein
MDHVNELVHRFSNRYLEVGESGEIILAEFIHDEAP